MCSIRRERRFQVATTEAGEGFQRQPGVAQFRYRRQQQGSKMKEVFRTAVATTVILLGGTASVQAVNAATDAPASQSSCCSDPAALKGHMDAHMKRMQDLHAQLQSASTPEDRKRLMDEQRREMDTGMTMMQGMSASGSMMGAAHPEIKGRTGNAADQKTQLLMLERRLDMMQAMMQTLLDQQAPLAGGPPLAPAK
jgi:hypothetical protein